jgi:hypothetical protein
MKMLYPLCLLLFVPSLVQAQTGSPNSDSSRDNSDVAAEVKALREALLQTQQQVALQQREIETLRERGKVDQDAPVNPVQTTPLASYTAIHTASSPVLLSKDSYTAGYSTSEPATQGQESESPLSFKIGPAVITPGGFVDLENIFRTTNTQNNIATNFAAIPFSNTAQGHLTEFRTTAQYSRFDITVRNKFGANDVTGYCEADFSGNDATNAYQTVNGHTLRLRLCFMDYKRGKWEILGGQTWSWLTPNRNGLGPMPSDLALTYNEDVNIQVGLTFSRAAEFRVAYHPNDHWAFGVGIEDPDQYIGDFVALPSAFASTLGSQFDNGALLGAPNLMPDILTKIAYDNEFGGRHFHWDATGLVTGARATVIPVGGTSFASHSDVGGGGQTTVNYQVFRNLLFLVNAYWSDGGARYLAGDGPQLVIRPNAAGTDITPSMVHAGAGSAGFEWNASRKTTLTVYYGADYFRRTFFVDTTDTTNPGTIIGYGGPGSPNTNNRIIQQPTFDWIQAFWKHPKYGALQFYSQYSYLTRAPWFVAAGSPKNAHLSMVYAGVRYVLPSKVSFDDSK